jgi:universal stress protein A
MSRPDAPAVPGHIVVATDFSPSADAAIVRGESLAARLGARLSLLHVVEPLPLVSGWGDAGAVAWIGLEALQSAGLQQLERQRDAHPALAGREVSLHCLVGHARRDLGPLAAGLGADLLLLGGRAPATFGDRLLGSTARAVVHGCPVPLLVCGRSGAAPWQRVVSAADFSAAAERAIGLADVLAPAATKRFVHAHRGIPEATLALVQPDPAALQRYTAEAEQEALARFAALQRRHPDWIGHFRRGEASDVVEAEAITQQADLVALGTRGHGRWLGGLLGSVGQRLLARIDADILLVPQTTADDA